MIWEGARAAHINPLIAKLVKMEKGGQRCGAMGRGGHGEEVQRDVAVR